MIMSQQNLDYTKHCAFSFGTYVQAHTEPSPSNTQEPRTLDAIYLRPAGNLQGGHQLMDLRTGRMLSLRKITPLPITQSVIDTVNAMAKSQDMPQGLKIATKMGRLLYDSTWIAGVDYEDNNDDDDNDENENEDENIDEDEDEQQDQDEVDPNEMEYDRVDQEEEFPDNDQEGNEQEDEEEEVDIEDANPSAVEDV
jgi:hypothetical protein